MNTQKQIFLIVVLFFTFVGGCAAYTAIDLPIRAEDQDDWHFEESVERGALLFANNCRTCHGNAGEGGVGPPLNREDWRNQDPLVLKNNKDLIRRTVACGRAGTAMPTWLQANGGPLNAVQVEHIVDFLTAPAEEKDEQGNPTSKGWLEAVEFAHNLNHETAVAVSGDTLSTIAQAHGIGYKEVADLNGLQPNSRIEQGARVKLPASKEFPGGRTVKILNDNATVKKVTDDFQVGAMIIADLNNIDYDIDADTNALTIKVDGRNVTGLEPGQELALPEGATYLVRAGDTIESIAEIHGVSASEVERLNSDLLGELEADEDIPHERRLELPSSPVYVTRQGDSYGVIATQHGLTPEELKSSNPDIDPAATPPIGQELKLPSGTVYIIQKGDTLETVAAKHRTSREDLARLNNIDASATIGPEVILSMPKVNTYAVQGQDLEAVAAAFGNVTAESLAEANDVEPDANLRVATPLTLPEDAWGSAAPTAINLGTGCTQYTIPQSVYEELVGTGTPTAPVTPPAQVSSNVTLIAHANDWTLEADGQSQPPNQGVAAVRPGTTINFRNDVGIHAITIDGEDIVNPWRQGATFQQTFTDPKQYVITCSIHPDMLANIFVQDSAGAATTPTAGATATVTAAATTSGQ